ncbi:arginine deiminase-related protein [Aliikangiella coralliicola]|nr:arginine deiminase-related protein [Aliikangiella coralliicola]
MVRPTDFGYNEQTGQDNEFQNKPVDSQANEITQKALGEFSQMVEQLESHGIEILILEKQQTTQKLPDAIFPNNWFSTREDGNIFIYPMKTPNRRAEIQIEPLQNSLKSKGYTIKNVIDLRQEFTSDSFLEGTGSLIFHHPTGQVFAALSERCHQSALIQFADKYQYQLSTFETSTASGKPVYHTNVLMSCGESFAVIAESVLKESSSNRTSMLQLTDTVTDLISISEQQMTENFCGNIIQVKNKQQQSCIIMSSSAHSGFSNSQRKQLEKHGELIVCDIPTIEHIGGGSARCMVAENFLCK